MTTVIQHLRRAVLLREAATLTDGQLLDCFLTQREEAAFAALVRRHGPLVFGVCRRILANQHDAEDAFQATFLVLARKGASIRPRDNVGPWLHGVALRTAAKARCRAARRRVVERLAVATRTVEMPSRDVLWRDLRPLLDSELQQLPEVYRAPVVLCDLEGASRGEAARQLGVPEGTISSRLARGREMLGKRLRIRGITLSAGILALVLAREARAALPDSLVETTINGVAGSASAPVAALAEGVLHTMFYSKCKCALAVLTLASVVGLGLGTSVHRVLAEKPKPAAAAVVTAADKSDKPEVGPSVNGVVHAVDKTKNTITLRVQEAPGKKETVERTYPLAKDAKIRLEHGLKKESKDGTLADVVEGRSVTVQLSVDKKSVLAVSIPGGSFQGSVKAVDATKNTITVFVKGKGEKGAEEKTFTLLPEAKVYLDDGIGKKGDAPKEGKLGDVGEGLPVSVQLSGYDRTQAVSVRVTGPSMNGAVKGVDVGNNTITITVKEDGQVVDKTLSLSKDVRIDGAKLTDLTGGNRVSLRLSVVDRKTVVGINVAKE